MQENGVKKYRVTFFKKKMYTYPNSCRIHYLIGEVKCSVELTVSSYLAFALQNFDA